MVILNLLCTGYAFWGPRFSWFDICCCGLFRRLCMGCCSLLIRVLTFATLVCAQHPAIKAHGRKPGTFFCSEESTAVIYLCVCFFFFARLQEVLDGLAITNDHFKYALQHCNPSALRETLVEVSRVMSCHVMSCHVVGLVGSRGVACDPKSLSSFMMQQLVLLLYRPRTIDEALS